MKASRRNKRNAIAKAEKIKSAPPPLSKYAAKTRGIAPAKTTFELLAEEEDYYGQYPGMHAVRR